MRSSFFAKLITSIVNGIGRMFSFTDLFCGAIVFVGIYSFWKIHRDVKKNIKSINCFIANSDNIRGEPKDRLTIVEEDDLFDGNEYLYRLWSKYKIHVRNNNIQGKYPDIAVYFSKFNLIDMPGKRKMAEIIPGMLTALGILGTFLGLQEGVSHIDTTTPEKVKESIEFLTSGMSLAFVTSIVGIISSTMWSKIDRKRYKEYIETLDRFYTVFDEKYPVFNSNYFFNEILVLQKDSTEAVKHMATDLSLEFSKILSKSIFQDIIPSIDMSINHVVNRDLKPTFKTMTDMIDNFTVNASENQANSLNTMADSFMNKLNSVVNVEFDNLANTLNEVTKWHMETKDSFDGLLEEIKETSLNQNEINISSEEVISRYTEMFDRFEEMNGLLEEELKDIYETMVKLKEVSNVNIDTTEQLNSIQQNTHDTVELIQNNINSLRENWDMSRDSLESMNGNLEDSTVAFSESLKDGLETTFNIFDDGLSEIAKRLSGTILEVQETVDELPRVISLLTKELEDSMELLNNAVDDINSFYKDINKKIEELKGEVIV